MFIKYLPALLMLMAGIIALVSGMIKRIDLLLSLEILFLVMIVFFGIGKVVQKMIINMIETNKRIEKEKEQQKQQEQENEKEQAEER